MKLDILGNEVRLGDTVRFMQIKYREFMDGTIKSVADTSALISHKTTNTCSTESRQRYDQMISLSALERNRRAGKDTNVATNADRIRGMSDEELAKEMLFFVPSDFNRHYTGLSGGYYATADEAIQASLDWLKQPAKEE